MHRFLMAATCMCLGCEPSESCDEDTRAQVLEERLEVQVGGEPLRVELADEQVERERGWRHRLCDREGILLVPDQREPLPIFGCDLVLPVDAAFIVDDAIVQTERVEPCPAPCDGCPTFGEGLDVDGVLEVPVDRWDLAPGTPVTRLP